MREAHQVQLPLFPETESITGTWLDLPYDFASLDHDVEVIFLESRIRELRRARLNCPRKASGPLT